MANAELRRQLEQLARQFVDGVISAVSSAPVDAVAELGGRGGGRGRAARRGAGRAARAAESEAAEGGRRAGRGGGRKLVRRSGAEIERLRSSILSVLRAANKPIGAAEIARKIGSGVKSAQLAFPMSQLRDRGLVTKQGERTQAVYSLTATGRAAGKKGAARAAAGRKKGK
jgi:DNA-binding transcriptional ArsR family regulator